MAAAQLMLSRYTCGLQEDEQLLQKVGELPPRLQAALRARLGEKRCLHALLKVRAVAVNVARWGLGDHSSSSSRMGCGSGRGRQGV